LRGRKLLSGNIGCRYQIVLVFVLFIWSESISQNILSLSKDNALLQRSALLVLLLPGYKVQENLSYSLSLGNFFTSKNKESPHPNWLSLLQTLDYKGSIERKNRFIFNSGLHHELGFQYLFDSLLSKQQDRNTLTTRIKWPLFGHVSLSLASDAETQLLNTFGRQHDSSGFHKILMSAFLTPLQCVFSGGIDLSLKDLCSFNLGISSAKMTLVCDQSVYTASHQDKFFDVRKNEYVHFSYGISSELSLTKQFNKVLDWDCNIKAFKDFNMPLDVNINNELKLTAGRHFKTSIMTRITYDREVNPTVEVENMITVGFFIEVK
jgi:hypothetical protein